MDKHGEEIRYVPGEGGAVFEFDMKKGTEEAMREDAQKRLREN